MSLTINVNGLTLCHKGSGGVVHNTLPDVCKTPALGLPIPYENEAYSTDLTNGTSSVFADGGNMIANYGSQFARSVFDEPGSIGGIISGTNRAEADWISHSFDVFFEKKPACRLTDKMFMNHHNTVCLAGLIQKFLDEGDIEKFKNQICEWAKECYVKYCGGGLGPKADDKNYAHYQDCLNEKIREDTYSLDKDRNLSYPSGDTAVEVSFKKVEGKWKAISSPKEGTWVLERGKEDAWKMVSGNPYTPRGGRRLDLIIKTANKIKMLFDVKFPGDRFADGQEAAYKEIAKDLKATFKPFWLKDDCPDWPECPKERKVLNPEVQKALQADLDRQMHRNMETDWTLVTMQLAAIAATISPVDGPAGDVIAWDAVAARMATSGAGAGIRIIGSAY